MIRNTQQLLQIGDRASRDVLLSIANQTLASLNITHAINSCLTLDGDTLCIGDSKWDLSAKKRLYVVGAGKASGSMAQAVEGKLVDRIHESLVIVKQLDSEESLKHIELYVGGHPLPNQASLLASGRIVNMVEQASPDDLFIGLISGGSSALMAYPVPEISLEDEIDITKELLWCGARIEEINAVRRHISATNGGRLAQRVEDKGAEMINLIISDVVSDGQSSNLRQPVKFFGTPVAPDNTSVQDAIDVLKKYSLQTRSSQRILQYLSSNERTKETPKTFGARIHNFVIQTPRDGVEAARKAAVEKGLQPLILTTMMEGESREAGTFLACIAKEISFNHRPIHPPCVLIAGGETTTRVKNEQGLGGPAQELCLGFALEIAGLSGCCIAAIDTDGTDGPTQVAGGIADSTTVRRARLSEIDLWKCLEVHDSHGALTALGDTILTGNTGTNVCDLNIVYIPDL